MDKQETRSRRRWGWGTDLRAAVRIGTHSSYVPDPRAPVGWDD